MRISDTNKHYFGNRNITIRKAGDLALEVNRLFPSVSLSKVSKFDSYSFLNVISDFTPLEKTKETMRIMRNNISKYYSNTINLFDGMMCYLDSVKKYKVANCEELSIIALIMARCRGIKNCSVHILKNEFGIDMDHSVLYVNDKNPYIIDAWLGFADYVPEAIERYNCEFRQFINFKNGNYTKVLLFNEPDSVRAVMANYTGFSQENISRITNKYPQIVAKN